MIWSVKNQSRTLKGKGLRNALNAAARILLRETMRSTARNAVLY